MIQYLIQLNYRSCKSVEFWCDKFEVKPNGQLTWKASGANFRPLSICNDITDIESIWQINSREVPDEIPLPVIEE